MLPTARNMQASTNDGKQSFESLEETRDLEGRLEDNQFNSKQKAAFGSDKDRPPLDQNQVNETKVSSLKESLNQGPAQQANNAAPAPAAKKATPKSLIWMLLVSLTVSQLMYLLLITIVVPYGRKKYRNDLNAIHYGVIGSMQQVARIFFSISIGKTLQKVGKKNYILIGFFLMILASAGFALLDLMSETLPYLFFAMCLLLNFVMGAGATCLQIIAQAIVLVQFTTNREVGLAYLSAARGLGFLGGPILGQVFVNNLGYWQSFVIFSGFLLLTLGTAFFVLPGSLNVDDNSKSVTERRKTLKKAQAQVTYGEIFRIPRAQFALFTVLVAMIFSLFMSTYISQYIQEAVEVPQEQVGYYIAIWAACYTVSAFLVGPLTKKISSAYVSCGSYLLITIGCIFFGPSKILQFPDQKLEEISCNDKFGPSCYDQPDFKSFCDGLFNECNASVRTKTRVFLIVGLMFLGTASGSVVVPILVELVTAVKEALGAKPGANEKGSALFTMFGAIGSILAAIIGSALYEQLGNNYTSDIFGACSLLMLIVFFLVNIYPGYLLKKPSEDPAEPQKGAATEDNQIVTQNLEEQQQQQPLMQRDSHLENRNSLLKRDRSASMIFRRQIEEAEARQSRLFTVSFHASGNDLVLPVTQELKMYLEGIDEDAEEAPHSQGSFAGKRYNIN